MTKKKKARSLETKDEDRSNSCGPLSVVFSIPPEQQQRGKTKRRTPLLSHKLDVLKLHHEILSYASIPDQQPNLFSSGRTLCFLWKGQHKSQPAFRVLPLFVTAFLFYPFLVFSSVLKPISDSLFETRSFRNTLQFSDTITHGIANINTSGLLNKAVKLCMLRNHLVGHAALTTPRSVLWFFFNMHNDKIYTLNAQSKK